MSRLEEIAFHMGQIEEADRWIEKLQKMKSKYARTELAKAKQFRNEAKNKIVELSGAK